MRRKTSGQGSPRQKRLGDDGTRELFAEQLAEAVQKAFAATYFRAPRGAAPLKRT